MHLNGPAEATASPDAHLEDLIEAAADVSGRHFAVVQGHCHRCKRDRNTQEDAADDEHCQIECCARYYHAQVKQQPRYQHRLLAPVLPVGEIFNIYFIHTDLPKDAMCVLLQVNAALPFLDSSDQSAAQLYVGKLLSFYTGPASQGYFYRQKNVAHVE
jgi:hypothetical protein